MTERDPSASAEGESADEPPRLQDTAERDALRLPLPGSEQPPSEAEPPGAVQATPGEALPPEAPPAAEPVPAPEAAPPSEPPASAESPAAPEPSGEADAEATRAPDPAPAPQAEPMPEPLPAEAFAPPPPPPSPSDVADDEDSGPPVEMLVGAAFAGGLALAILVRRLRS